MMNKLRFLFGFFVFAVVIFGGLCGIMLVSWDELSGNERFLAVGGLVLFVIGIVVSFVFRSISFVGAEHIYDPLKNEDEIKSLREELDLPKPVVPVEPPIVKPVSGFKPISDDVSMYEDDDEPEPQTNRNIIKPPLQRESYNKNNDEYEGVF